MSKCVSSKIKINRAKITQLDNATVKALEQTVDALYTEVVESQVMPFKTGNMQNDNTAPDY